MRSWSRLRACLVVLAAMPVFVQPLALCAFIQCARLNPVPVAEQASSQCSHCNVPAEAPTCHSQKLPDSSTRENCVLLTAPPTHLALPAAVSHAPELALLTIATPIDALHPLTPAIFAERASPTHLPPKQFDPVVAQGPRAPPPPGICPSDWV